jgi:hypothetical protein
MEREDLLKALGKAASSERGPKQARVAGSASRSKSRGGGSGRQVHSLDMALSPKAQPLPTDPAVFWGNGADFAFPEAGDAPQSPPLFGRLGSFPFWRGGLGFRDTMEEIYRQASPVGMDMFLGQGESEEESGLI